MKCSAHAIIVTLILLLSLSCTNQSDKEYSKPLSENEKELIDDFAVQLTASLEKYQYDFIRSSWNNVVFKNRVGELNRTEKNMYKNIFETKESNPVLLQNIELVNKLKYNDGSIYLTKTEYFHGYAEITYSMLFEGFVDFLKYRIELIDDVPVLSDFYSFRDEIWQSENVKNMIRLNTRYTASSPERQQANKSLRLSEKALRQRDTLLALEYLYQVPETHIMGNSLSMRKINLAMQMDEEVLASVLKSEQEFNNTVYIRYLYGYYFQDTSLLNQVFDELENKVGQNAILDSLKTLDYLWY